MKVRGLTLLELLAVIAIIAVLFGLVVSGLAMTRQHAYAADDIDRLHQIGLAEMLYEEEAGGPVWRTEPLAALSRVPKVLLASALDDSTDGIANQIRSLTHSPLDPKTPYKDSFLPAPAVMTPYALSVLPTTQGAGWLVSLGESQLLSNAPSPQPLYGGSYLRLMMDGSVKVKHHHIRQDYPVAGLKNFQNMCWWFTDQDNAFEPGWHG